LTRDDADTVLSDEVAFWRGFITWWAQAKSEPVPARAWAALERAQRRAELAEGASVRWRRNP